ncbi:MAG: hypothetical protein ACI9PY_001707 [Ascidiaceihabitans sp.]|jgi:hypothetical protein
MKLKRSGMQTALVALNLVLVSAVAALYVTDALDMGGAFNWGASIILSGWATFIMLNLLRRSVYAEIEDDGLTIHRVLTSVYIPWGQMQWVNIVPDSRISLIAYRRRDSSVESYAGLSNRLTGDDGKAALLAAIQNARPDIPTRSPNDTAIPE